MTKMRPLTTSMAHVLRLMQAGWEMGIDISNMGRGRTWIQQNGIGRGGPTEDVNKRTFDGLWDRGLIEESKRGFPSSLWKLTRQGKSHQTESE